MGLLPFCAQLLESCLTFCNLRDYSPPGSSIHGILQQEYWQTLPSPPPGDIPHPRIKPTCSALQENFLPLSYQGSPWCPSKRIKKPSVHLSAMWIWSRRWPSINEDTGSQQTQNLPAPQSWTSQPQYLRNICSLGHSSWSIFIIAAQTDKDTCGIT